MPVWLLKAFQQMQTTLHARESIHRINELSYAFGAMKPEDGRSFIAELNRLAAGTQGMKAYRPKDMREMAGMVGSGGKVQMVME